MKPVSGHDGDRGRSGLMVALSGVRWTRVLLAGVAVHIISIILPVLLIFAYSLLADGGSVEGFAGQVATWSLPVMTLPAAIWAARGARPTAAILEGLMVGLLVAGTFGLLFFWPNDLHSLAQSTLTIAASFLRTLQCACGCP